MNENFAKSIISMELTRCGVSRVHVEKTGSSVKTEVEKNDNLVSVERYRLIPCPCWHQNPNPSSFGSSRRPTVIYNLLSLPQASSAVVGILVSTRVERLATGIRSFSWINFIYNDDTPIVRYTVDVGCVAILVCFIFTEKGKLATL